MQKCGIKIPRKRQCIDIKLKPFAQFNKTEIKVLFQTKQNAKTAVKRFNCVSQSQSVSALYGFSAQTADTEWIG